MQFQIDNSSSRPVYQQIVDQVKRDIALGKLARDEKLPTVRELAARLVINPNTIAKAFRQLEQEGIIVTRPGSGSFVAALDSSLSKSVRKKVICEQIEHLAVDAIHMQIDKSTLAEWFKTALEKFQFPEDKGKSHE
jgi:GntR family transcriptional regulator